MSEFVELLKREIAEATDILLRAEDTTLQGIRFNPGAQRARDLVHKAWECPRDADGNLKPQDSRTLDELFGVVVDLSTEHGFVLGSD